MKKIALPPNPFAREEGSERQGWICFCLTCLMCYRVYEVVLTFSISQIERSLCLCAVKPRWSPRSCTTCRTKIRWNMKFCLICLWQNMVRFQKVTSRKSFNAVFTSWKPLVGGRLLLRFHAAVPVVCGQPAPQQLALVVASVHAYRAVAHSRVFTRHWFCLVFSKKFNIMSALSAHQPLSLPQKFDSREGLFWCKKGLVCACGRMNFYLNKPLLAPIFWLFAAKCDAICC